MIVFYYGVKNLYRCVNFSNEYLIDNAAGSAFVKRDKKLPFCY